MLCTLCIHVERPRDTGLADYEVEPICRAHADRLVAAFTALEHLKSARTYPPAPWAPAALLSAVVVCIFAVFILRFSPSAIAPTKHAPLFPDSSSLPVKYVGYPLEVVQSSEFEALGEKLGSSVVRVQTDRGVGVGFVVGDGRVVTAHHVVSGAQRVRVILPGDFHPIEVAEYAVPDTTKDVAVLRIDTQRKLTPLLLASGLPAEEERVAYVKVFGRTRPGKVGKTGITLAVGSGETRSRRVLKNATETTCGATPGWSGSPLVNMKGEVVGMCSACPVKNSFLGFVVDIPGRWDHAVNAADIRKVLASADGDFRKRAVLDRQPCSR